MECEYLKVGITMRTYLAAAVAVFTEVAWLPLGVTVVYSVMVVMMVESSVAHIVVVTPSAWRTSTTVHD